MKEKGKIKLRIVIASIISIFSLIIGLTIGININFNKGGSEISTHEKIINILQDEWLSEIYYPEVSDENALIAQFVSSIYNIENQKQLDPYTYIYKEVPSSSSSSSGKMGITITKTFGYPVISKIDKNSAADGILKINDIVLGIGKEIEDKTIEYHYLNEIEYDFNSIFTYGAGEIDEERYIVVARINENGNFDVIQKKIALKAGQDTQYSYVESCDIDDTLMVKLTGFTSTSSSNDTAGQLHAILKENAESENKKNNLIINLRDNGGGALSSVVDVCDLFLTKNQLITTLKLKDGRNIDYYSSDDEAYTFDNIIILMNENTASASEILITCLDYYFENVTLIGTTSYGKGIAQKTISVGNNLYLQYTFAKWFAPDGTWIHKNGIAPTSNEDTFLKNDILNEMNKYNNYLYFDNDLQLYDKVSNYNLALAIILNKLENYQIREDGYFDDNFKNAIMQYQVKKNLESNGVLNEDTFIQLIFDYINQKDNYTFMQLNRASQIING